MRWIAPTLCALAVLIGVAGCGDDGVDRAGGEVPEVEVLDPGAEPRRVLALEPEVGQRIDQRLELDLDIEFTVDGQPAPSQNLPTITYELSSTVESVSDSEIDVAVEYGSASLRGPSGLDEATEAQLLESLNAFDGLTGSLTLAANGALVDATFDSLDTGDPVADSFAQQINEQARSLTIPLPEEEVGEGARWSVETELDLQGLVSTIGSTYTLESLRGDRYSLSLEIDQDTSGEGPGGITVESDETTGTGTLEGDLGLVVPIESQATTGSTVTSSVPAGDDATQELIQEISTEFRLSTPD